MDALLEPLEALMADIREKWSELSGEQGILESLTEFAKAIDWTEPLVVSLLSFHAVLLLLVVAMRKNGSFQAAVFFLGVSIVFCAESLNKWMAANWRTFARQPYFDPNGIFMSTMLSGPIMLVLFLQLINYLWEASSLLVSLKRRQLMHQACQRRAESQDGQDSKKHK
ncbi:unnamed protein product [Ostreobium quekettii]|uniref:Transmembrane protein 18 n=1 Tax=Ostreobium quekettii TaxID=121088 RepID=A0A8S1J3D0_9CHLO|nr:unnamed protein product [Ostreobium quekettii]|eukprot:evm.model.scf_1437.1 EVM.evm.TU.scf_1437.1   scf_1437:1339-3768(-)